MLLDCTPSIDHRHTLAWGVREVMRDFSLPVLDAALSQRSAFAQSAVHGAFVFALGSAAAAAQDEAEKVVAAVLKQLEDPS